MPLPSNEVIEGHRNVGTVSARGCIAISYGGGDQSLTQNSRGIYITTAGALSVTFVDGSTGVFTGLQAGQVYPFQVTTIKQSSSTAAGFVLV